MWTGSVRGGSVGRIERIDRRGRTVKGGWEIAHDCGFLGGNFADERFERFEKFYRMLPCNDVFTLTCESVLIPT